MKHKLENRYLASITASLWLLAAVMLMTGCSFTKGTRTAKDGSVLQVTNARLLWSSQGIEFETRDTNGFAARLKIQQSNPDAQALEAISYGASKGTAEGLTGKK